MREIKFRAWNLFEKKMVYFELAQAHEVSQKSFAVDPVMQYTGLKDKNGREIYEGDLLGIQHKNDYEIAAVLWGEGEWLAGILALNANLFMEGKAACDLEVVGNIYENPELLK